MSSKRLATKKKQARIKRRFACAATFLINQIPNAALDFVVLFLLVHLLNFGPCFNQQYMP